MNNPPIGNCCCYIFLFVQKKSLSLLKIQIRNNMNCKELHLQTLMEQLATELSLSGCDLISDGVYDWDRYINSPLRLMVVMKEAWDEIDTYGNPCGGGWHICKECFGKADAWRGASWQPLIYIAYALFKGLRYEEMDYIRDDKSMAEALKQIAYINTNKMPALKFSNDDNLYKTYEIWRPVLMEQIKTYAPQVILFANTFKFYKADLVGEEAKPIFTSPSGSLHLYKKGDDSPLLLDAYHPNNRTYSRDIYVNDILETVRKFITM